MRTIKYFSFISLRFHVFIVSSVLILVAGYVDAKENVIYPIGGRGTLIDYSRKIAGTHALQGNCVNENGVMARSYIDKDDLEHPCDALDGLNMRGNALRKYPKTILKGANATSSDFSYARLKGFQLQGLIAPYATFYAANLTSVKSNAASDFKFANFAKACLCGAKLKDCKMESSGAEGFRGAFFDNQTELPFDGDTAIRKYGMIYREEDCENRCLDQMKISRKSKEIPEDSPDEKDDVPVAEPTQEIPETDPSQRVKKESDLKGGDQVDEAIKKAGPIQTNPIKPKPKKNSKTAKVPAPKNPPIDPAKPAVPQKPFWGLDFPKVPSFDVSKWLKKTTKELEPKKPDPKPGEKLEPKPEPKLDPKIEPTPKSAPKPVRRKRKISQSDLPPTGNVGESILREIDSQEGPNRKKKSSDLPPGDNVDEELPPDEAEIVPPKCLEICLALDRSTSMNNDYTDLRERLGSMQKNWFEKYPGCVDLHFVEFARHPNYDPYVVGHFKGATDLDSHLLPDSGPHGRPEYIRDASMLCARQIQSHLDPVKSPVTKRMVFVVTDEPGGNKPTSATPDEILAELKARDTGIVIIRPKNYERFCLSLVSPKITWSERVSRVEGYFNRRDCRGEIIEFMEWYYPQWDYRSVLANPEEFLNELTHSELKKNPTEVCRQLVDALLGSTPVQQIVRLVKEQNLRCHGKLHNEDVTDLLKKAKELGDRELEVALIGILLPEDAEERLREFAVDSNPSVQNKALIALSEMLRMDEVRATEWVKELLLELKDPRMSESSREVRLKIIARLAAPNSPAAKVLMHELDGKPLLWLQAVQLFNLTDTSEKVAALLTSTDAQVQILAMQTLLIFAEKEERAANTVVKAIVSRAMGASAFETFEKRYRAQPLITKSLLDAYFSACQRGDLPLRKSLGHLVGSQHTPLNLPYWERELKDGEQREKIKAIRIIYRFQRDRKRAEESIDPARRDSDPKVQRAAEEAWAAMHSRENAR